MKILYASAEVAPFAKTGGLADVAGALPKALAGLGHDVRVIMPCYASIKERKCGIKVLLPDIEVHFPEQSQSGKVKAGALPGSTVPVYFVDRAKYFGRSGLYQKGGEDYTDNAERFAFFSMAALWTLKSLDWQPDVICCNDWQCGLIPAFLKNLDVFSSDPFYNRIKVLYTIHNLAYQGLAESGDLPKIGLPWSVFTPDGLEFYGRMNLMKSGIVYADKVSTVSSRYAEEIQTVEFGCGLEGILAVRKNDLSGIINGIDLDEWNPEVDNLIAANFSAKSLAGKAKCKAALQKKCGLPMKKNVPVIGMISRLADQKGFDLIAKSAAEIMALDMQFVLLGTGDLKYHKLFEKLAEKHPKKASVHLTFNNRLAHEIEAGSDMFLMPSRYEPCGLNQLYSLRYGTIPIVRETGGLADSIIDFSPADSTGAGFVFKNYNSAEMLKAVTRAVDLYHAEPKVWKELRKRAMAQDFSWAASARKYEELLQTMIA